MIKDFIGELAKYYNMENDLSNITVALCNSDKFFKEKFIKFFFPNLDIDKIDDIQREVPDVDGMGSRVDIYIKMVDEKLPYLIEVKIGDQNHHFGQYEEAYKIGKSRLGYITNYCCSEGLEKGYDVKTWEQFYNELIPFAKKDNLINSYLSYLKQVCNIIIYDRPMKFSNLNAIPQFIETVTSLLEKDAHPAKVWFSGKALYGYEGGAASAALKSFYFSFPEQSKQDSFATIGLWFQKKPIITIGVSSSPWLSEAILKHHNNFADCQYCSMPYPDFVWQKDDVWCDLQDEKLKELQGSNSVEHQNEILSNFINEFLTKVKPLFK